MFMHSPVFFYCVIHLIISVIFLPLPEAQQVMFLLKTRMLLH